MPLTIDGCECHCHCGPVSPCKPVINGVAACCLHYVTEAGPDAWNMHINTQTGELKFFSESGVPVGGPDDAEGTPLWQPVPDDYQCGDYNREIRCGIVPPSTGEWLGIERKK